MKTLPKANLRLKVGDVIIRVSEGYIDLIFDNRKVCRGVVPAMEEKLATISVDLSCRGEIFLYPLVGLNENDIIV